MHRTPPGGGGASAARRLRKLLLKFLFAQQGQDAERDRLLAGLRRALRSGAPDSDIDRQAGAILTHLTAARSVRRQRSCPPPARVLERLLEQVAADGVQAQALRQALARVRAAGGEAAYQATLIGECARALREAMHVPHAGAEHRADPPPRAEPAAAAIERLLDALLIPRPLVAAHAEARAALHAGDDGALAMVERLLAALQRHWQDELAASEGYLRMLLERLEALGERVLGLRSAAGEAEQAEAELAAELGREVERMRTGAAACDDLASVRALIDERLMAIDEGFERFVAEQQQRWRRADEATARLGEEVAALREETTRLRSTVATERERATVDALTGVPNRIAYEERAAEETRRWQRYRRPLSLVVVDIDHFKRINDRYGHQAGDKVLRTVAQRMGSQIRGTDLFARYGGEEFVMLLPETDLEAATTLADKLCGDIAQCRFHYREEAVPVTVSCGVAQFAPGESAEEAFERADRALYRAKQTGRNRVLADDSVSAPASQPLDETVELASVLAARGS